MIHKKFLRIVAICLIAGLAACTPDEIEPIGEVFSKTTPMQGAWLLTSITQVDEIAVATEKGQTTQDLTPYFDFTDYQLTLGADNSFSFSAGKAPDYIGKSAGNWMLDSEEYPTELYLIEGQDTVKLALERVSLPNSDKLEVNLERWDAGVKYLSYQFVFEK